MRAKDVIIFFVCLQFAGIIAGVLASNDVIMMGTGNLADGSDLAAIEQQFSLTSFIAVSSAIGGVTGLIALITRSGTYANYATLIWVVGLFGGVTTWILTGFTNIFDILLPAEINPGGIFSTIINGGVLVVFYFFLAGAISQRPDL
jgi:hypothetical protein